MITSSASSSWRGAPCPPSRWDARTGCGARPGNGPCGPYCLLAIKGSLGLGLLIIIWLLAIFGIIYHILAKKRLQWIETLTFVIMGWLCLVGARPLAQALGSHGLTLLVFGGIVFTLGALVYSIKGVKYAHVYWHFFVMLGSLLMFFSIYYYI